MGLRVQIYSEFLYNAQDGVARKWVALDKKGTREYREVPLQLSLCRDPLKVVHAVFIGVVATLEFPLEAREGILLKYGFRKNISFDPNTNAVTVNKGTPNSTIFPW
jgi:hypothetical protein